MKCHWRVARALIVFEDGFIRGFRAVTRNRQDGSQKLRLVSCPDFDDVAIGNAVRQLEDVSSRRQHLAGDFDGVSEGYYGFFIPVVCFDRRTENGAEHKGADGQLDYFYDSHVTTSSFKFSRAAGLGRRAGESVFSSTFMKDAKLNMPVASRSFGVSRLCRNSSG